MNPHFPDVRTLEVHPITRRNPHLIRPSSSGPEQRNEERNELGLPLLLEAVGDAADLGYNFLSVAGEDPLLYTGLQALCCEAHRRGVLTSITVHPAACALSQLDWLRHSIDLLGFAIDARTVRPPRGRRASRVAQATGQQLERVRRSGMQFAIIFTLTAESLSHLEWAAEFASDRGAAMLQVRLTPGLTDEQISTAWMIAECLRELHRGRLVVHLDAMSRYNLPLEPADLSSWRKDVEREARYLGEIVSPLVIEDTGAVAPMRFGFPRRFAFGNVLGERLRTMAERWIETRAADFCTAYGAALEKARTGDRTFGDLYEMLSTEAGSAPLGMSAVG